MMSTTAAQLSSSRSRSRRLSHSRRLCRCRRRRHSFRCQSQIEFNCIAARWLLINFCLASAAAATPYTHTPANTHTHTHSNKTKLRQTITKTTATGSDSRQSVIGNWLSAVCSGLSAVRCPQSRLGQGNIKRHAQVQCN